MRGDARFVLSGSGHIAGMINPPAANKYGYWTNDDARRRPRTRGSPAPQQHEGSWWPDWRAMDRRRTSSAKCRRACPGKGKLPVIEAAPGSYARLRADDSD